MFLSQIFAVRIPLKMREKYSFLILKKNEKEGDSKKHILEKT